MDTSGDVNIMQASVYKLVFNNPELQKLAPSTLEIGTYTADTVKIIGSCLFYLVHPYTKKLQGVTFYVAQNDGSVLLSCTITLALGLIQSCTRLYYFPPKASLITSSVDHPKKYKRVSVHSSRKEVSAQNSKQAVTVSDQQQLVSKVVTGMVKFYKATKMSLRILDAFQVPHTIYSWIQVLHLSRHLVDQFQCTWKKLLNKRLTWCWKWKFWSQYLKPRYVLKALYFLCLLMGKTRLATWILESAWTPPSLIKQ